MVDDDRSDLLIKNHLGCSSSDLLIENHLGRSSSDLLNENHLGNSSDLLNDCSSLSRDEQLLFEGLPMLEAVFNFLLLFKLIPFYSYS